MAISRKTAAEFATDIESAIKLKNGSYDTKIGPIPDLVINPLANVLELQNDKIRKVNLLLSLANSSEFSSTDIDEIVYNEGLLRSSGSKATVTLIFSSASTPTVDVTIGANFPVATLPDEDTGAPVTFLTVASTTMYVANAESYYNIDTQRYELQVQAQSVLKSDICNVAPNRVINPLRGLGNYFSSVFNREAAVGGSGTETSSRLIERYFLTLLGSSPVTMYGIKKTVYDRYPAVSDINVVYGNNSLNVRGASNSGAVDAYVIGTTSTSITENIIFTGLGRVIPLSKQPVLAVSSVGDYTEDVDYELVRDTSGLGASVRGADGIKFINPSSCPTINTPVSVTYTYNSLIVLLQDAFSDETINNPGRDLLFKAATKVDVVLSANVRIRPGYGESTVLNSLSTNIQNAINSLKLNNPVEQSDIQLVARSMQAVDNFVITDLHIDGSSGVADLSAGPNEYFRLDASNITLTAV